MSHLYIKLEHIIDLNNFILSLKIHLTSSTKIHLLAVTRG